MKKAVNLYLDSNLIDRFDTTIFPFHRSNVITKLISEFLENNGSQASALPRTMKTKPDTKEEKS